MAERFPTVTMGRVAMGQTEERIYRDDVIAQDHGNHRMEAVIMPQPIKDTFSILFGGDIYEIAGVVATELTGVEAGEQTSGGLVVPINSAPAPAPPEVLPETSYFVVTYFSWRQIFVF
ncbi:uncharacterized protein LOC125510489 [Triticum urartu]|uniref:uncharacterized protein LOC125510489 n=1 Tax=Triticum urartu TaxID=4572 RepID=UPI0020442B50|nr:uncharacterized protein LOC125510489 [Triticum urartu]